MRKITVIGAGIVREHSAGKRQKMPLKTPVGQMCPQIRNFTDASMGIVFNVIQAAIHKGVQQSFIDGIPFHKKASRLKTACSKKYENREVIPFCFRIYHIAGSRRGIRSNKKECPAFFANLQILSMGESKKAL